MRNKAIYIALGILPDGTKEILGIWIEQTEGAKFWLRVMNELKNRGQHTKTWGAPGMLKIRSYSLTAQ